jgi:hypothetical protein
VLPFFERLNALPATVAVAFCIAVQFLPDPLSIVKYWGEASGSTTTEAPSLNP